MSEDDGIHRDALDEMLEETFPASDAPSETVETGVRVGPRTAGANDVRDNRGAKQFELTKNGETAILKYERDNGRLVLIHTEVPADLRGHHIGDRLVEFALATGRRDKLRIIVECPFARAYLRKHPDALSQVE